MPGETDTPIILDTHSWIWLLDGNPDIAASPFVQAAELVSVTGRLYVCSISIAEVALLASAGRARLTIPVSVWIDQALDTPGLQVVEIDGRLAAEAASLPGTFGGDAADRLIVASARLLGGRLATADPAIREYGSQGYVRILPVEPAQK